MKAIKIKIKIEREKMHLGAVTPKPQKPARRLVRRAPTTAPWTGLKKVEKTNQNSLHCTLGTGRFLKIAKLRLPKEARALVSNAIFCAKLYSKVFHFRRAFTTNMQHYSGQSR